MDKQAAWEALKREAVGRFGAEMGFGEGPLDARLVIVGEALGEQELKARRPFVGRAGQMLDQLLKAAGIDRAATYVTNTVKIRPTAVVAGRVKNRAPRVGELKEGLAILRPEIELIAPDALILLGNVPAKALIDKSFAMGANHGAWYQSILGFPALATYHPAYLIRLEGADFDRIHDVIVNDLIEARGALDTAPAMATLPVARA